ncbi:MAG: CotH kinase family protein [Candidatus Latescibacterota bacterium]
MKLKSCFTLIAVFLFVNTGTAMAQVMINELVASNTKGITDEDGDYEDWIELYNAGTSTVDLNGYGLSDEASLENKWIFPGVPIEPQGFLLVYASGKNRRNLANHRETIIPQGDNWRYRLGLSEPPSGWRMIEFDDSAWKEGPSGFGYGDGDDATVIPLGTISTYIRKTFTIDDVNEITHLLLYVDYDDAFVAYLNDTEIARANVGVPGDHPAYDQTSITDHEALVYQGGSPELSAMENIQSILLPGENVLAIQVHNTSPSSSDLTLIPFLTLGMKNPSTETPGEAPALLPNSLSRLHTNFRLARDGEFIGLCAPSGAVIDSVVFGEQPPDTSFGRQPDGGDSWYYFVEPTPNAPNNTGGVAGFAESPDFSPGAGFYNGALILTLTPSSPSATVYYTRDGSDPTESSAKYSSPIVVDTTTVIRARALGNDLLPSSIITQTYLINESFSLPVISLATDPPNLWDNDIGIYAYGNDYHPEFPYVGANFWQDWERPVHIEYFETDGAVGFSLDGGVKIHGNWMKAQPQKSLRIYARERYGTKEINYKIFDDKPIDEFKVILLRNSGNDWIQTHFRDALMHNLIKDADVDRMAYKPAIVFLNGQYWGIHNIRERQDKHYLQSNRGIDPENVDILENQGDVLEGDAVHYNSMIDYIETHPMRLDANFEHVQTLMDTDNFMDYHIFQIYYANIDWPGNNIKYWRPRTPDGRWKWLLYDTDDAFGLRESVSHNTLAFATLTGGPAWPNPPWSTLILRKLLENRGFKTHFINRFADLMNSTFLAEKVKSRIDQMKAALEADMPEHMNKWGGSTSGWNKWGGSMSEWNNHIDVLKDFAERRVAYVRSHIIDKFTLRGEARVILRIFPQGAGKVRINTLTVDSFPWSGTYFEGIPIELTAIPKPGYVFSGWANPSLPDTSSVAVNLTGIYSNIAIFEVDSDLSGNPIVINELMASNNNALADEAGEYDDWIELYNAGDKVINLGGMYLSDNLNNPTQWQIPDTAIAPGGFLLLWADGDEDQGPLHTSFGLNQGGEQLGLFDTDAMANLPIDTLTFGPQTTNLSYGRSPDGGSEWGTFDAATPGQSNSDTSVEIAANEAAQEIPTRFALSQNFPNPFNSSTAIRYSLASRTPLRTTLKIHDLLGREVRTLVDRKQSAGVYEVVWDGRDAAGKEVSSGVYAYRMRAGGVGGMRKLLLLR